jgi:cysteine desulfurase/selenocysteine lyase
VVSPARLATPELRAEFPVLARLIDGRPMTYLDSAATSLKPRAVLDAERAYSTEFTANVHRGRHALSEEASAAYEAARRRVARHLGTDPSGVVFLRNTTEAINLVAAGLGLRQEDVILVSSAEHHSNLIPWMKRATVRMFDADPTEALSVAQVAALLEQHRPRLLALGYASHVTGAIHPAAAICRAARDLGVLTLIDAAQAAPHVSLDVGALGCDFLAFSGHKMLAPAGIGVLSGSQGALDALDPAYLGGGTVERVTREGFTLKPLPYRLEAGTPNVGGALGLAAALDVLEGLGWDAIAEHERALAGVMERELAGLPGARVLLARGPTRLAMASIAPTSRRVTADHLALVLSDSYQVMARSGFHCAQPLFEMLGLPGGALRLSAYVYTTEEEIRRAAEALRVVLSRMVG